MTTYQLLDVAFDEAVPVASIRLLPLPGEHGWDPAVNFNWELAQVMTDLRTNNDVRVIVITGGGDDFWIPRPTSFYKKGQRDNFERTEPGYMWESFTGLAIMHEQMALMEKPIVAKVNGDAIGLGATLAFACDLILAREDAMFVDTHMGMGEHEGIGPAEVGIVPGDGATALVPLFLPPAVAKEYLMLSRAFSAAELARMGVINYALPADDLDDAVEQIVARLLKRSAHALAWTKRAANRLVAEQVVKAIDPGIAYEMVSFYQWQRSEAEQRGVLSGKRRGGS